jgi:hypothetical protein
MAKQVQKTSSKILKLNILKTISEHNKLPENISKSKLNYHLKPFLINKLVEKSGYGTWQITELGKATLNLKQVQILSLVAPVVIGTSKVKKIRGHGFMWKLQLPTKAYLSLENRKKLLRDYSELHNKVLKTEIKGNIVHLGNKTVIIYFNKHKSYLGRTANESFKSALFDFEKVIHKLENIYHTSLKIRKSYKFKVCRNHYGQLNNELARTYKEAGRTITIADNGRDWLTIDFSQKKFIETETIDSERAKTDMDAIIIPFFNDLRKEPHIISKIRLDNQEIKEELMKTQENLKLAVSIIKQLAEERNTSIDIDRFKY